ncbi:histone deacetylase 6-like [Ornithodoros turicata]|uniref:histone deacetylase 6-like n=1 Tax=Ornithodoros turicata TaxID=34597 RepID=UPI003139122B
MGTYRTCYVTDERMLEHWNDLKRWMPERPDRLRVAHQLLKSKGLLDRCLILKPRSARDEEIGLVHTEKHIETIRAIENMSLEEMTRIYEAIVPGTIIGPETNKCARLAAGCLLETVDAVITGLCRNGVALIRPPGHHSGPETVSGYCIFNNAAIAAEYALREHGLKRVLIFDWDVHHGNGTQEIFYNDNRVLYISLHRYSLKIFPFSEIADAPNIGEGPGKGYNINIPWRKPAMKDADYLAAMYQLLLPVASEFNPELVIISAGFDSAVGDFLGDCCVTPSCYGLMTSLLSNLAHGNVIVQLEGGYNVDQVAECLASCTSVLLGDACAPVTDLTPSKSALASIEKVKEAIQPYWACLTPEDTPIIVEPTNRIEKWQLPLQNCPHACSSVSALPPEGLKDRLDKAQGALQWLCLHCFELLSDERGDHMKQERHLTAINIKEMTVWCQGCQWIITHEALVPALAEVRRWQLGRV